MIKRKTWTKKKSKEDSNEIYKYACANTKKQRKIMTKILNLNQRELNYMYGLFTLRNIEEKKNTHWRNEIVTKSINTSNIKT